MDSQAIVNTMEVLETKPLSELVTEATVKVCYVSESPNPNQTVIDRETGKEIAATLPGAPVVGLFDPDTNDFVEHSRRLSIKDGEIKWEELTRPYGFVSPIHKPWYQDFMENGVIRTYLMCKAFLWTRQYKEASLVNDKGQSMELNEKDMSGYYEGDVFIFTHATLDKLCILGDKYAPCFEGAKFMTTYAKGYNSLAEEVESIIGKRYYVLNDKLVEKPITLNYAIEMGWNLEDAVYAQLMNRGTEERYRIHGIYAEENQTFVILQEVATQGYVKVDLNIIGSDTVELGTEMVAVSMEWIPKPLVDETHVEPLVPTEAVATETPASTTSIMQTESNTNIENNSTSAALAEEPVVQGDPVSENTPDNSNATSTENVAAEDGQQLADNAINKAAENINNASQPVDGTVVVDDPSISGMAADTNNDEGASSEEGTENQNATGNQSGEPQPEGNADGADGAGDPAPTTATDFAALSEKVTLLEQQLSEKTTRINELEAALNEYRKKDAEAEARAKAEMVTSYKAMLSEEEMKPITDKLSELSLEELEAKLSVTYTRKQRASTSKDLNVQVNIGAMTATEENIPEFMRQAAEYDRIHGLNINI